MNRYRILAIVLTLSLVSPLIPAVTANASQAVVHIYTAEDLCVLSQNCVYDKWSKNRTVILQADIDLEGRQFVPIPTFGGTFDGNHRTIRGLSVTVEGSNQGLFRYLQQGAIVKNLNVQGTVTPQGTKSNVGGIVGNNSGTLENCNFSGYVNGKDNIGGVVGRNSATGHVKGCSVTGIVYGKTTVGGVAGFNAGFISDCSNKSSVNTTVEEFKLGLEDLSLDDINPFNNPFVDALDIGGIAGLSIGTIESSVNRGSIGYPHVGYNVGGIAGRQSGHITQCTNYGHIQGRKEIGGIVGQMEPHITASIEPSKLRLVQKQLDTLQIQITNLITGTEQFSSTVNSDLNMVQKHLDDTQAYAESLISQTETLLNKDIEEINRLAAVMTHVTEQLAPVMSDFAAVTEYINKALPYIRQSVRYLGNAMARLPELAEYYGEFSEAMDVTVSILQQASPMVSEALQSLIDALTALSSGDVDEAVKQLSLVLEQLEKVSVIMEQAFESISAVQEQMLKIVTLLGDIGGDVGLALGFLADAMEMLEYAMAPIPSMLEDISAVMEYLAEQPALELETTDDVFQETEKKLFRSLDGLTDSMFLLINNMKREGDMLLGHIQAVSDQLFVVLDLLFDMAADVGETEIDPEQFVQDISRDETGSPTQGRVNHCENLGDIEGDLNVGGIAGAMAVEYILDAEEELSVKDKPSLSTVYKTRAVMNACRNTGAVTGKKNSVGGVVGNMDLGCIRECVSLGPAESTDGHYVGGIAGKAYGLVDSCYAKTTLSGGNYIGGIAGLGQEIVGCYSMVEVTRHRACVGAIAGYAEESSTIRNNFFVSLTLAGIDGISYESKAEPLTYAELLTLPNLPSVFKELKIRFWAEDVLVKSLSFEYGGTISAEAIPPVPAKSGHYGKWENTVLTNLTFDRDIKVEYHPYITTLESKEKRRGPLPVVVVEGLFTHEDSLCLTPLDTGDDEYEFAETWQVTIPGSVNSGFVIRFIPETDDRSTVLYALENGNPVKIDAQWDGKYLRFTCADNCFTFSVALEGVCYTRHLVLGGILMALAALILVKKLRKVAISKEMKHIKL